MSRRNVARKIKCIASGVLLGLGALVCAPPGRAADSPADPVIERFKRDYGTGVGRYEHLFTKRVNGKLFLFAYWYDGSPVQLMVDIFNVNALESRGEIYRWYRGLVSEEVVSVVQTDVDGDGEDELIFVSESGQIKLVRILKDTGREFTKIFDSGAKEVTLFREGPRFKMMFKVTSADEVAIYGWSKTARKLVIEKRHRLLY